jgi:hypothetical protein
MVGLTEGFQIELNNQEREFESNVVSNWKIQELALSENPSALPQINHKKLISASLNFPNPNSKFIIKL